ncbi:glycerophosphodiester phosphodiesterase [Loigolactobacillus bifermentans]|jgi:glycerophosphoryl diester phosphodiesterase|uniref:Glycerophosphodiester phosphodiesterase family protein n=1 Tax=Loigolactobacillus bifermentans DSM 20003 TaxID=1423726 RepID=A0A0R1GH60_9LACO|nr:glycerophosphodiester phosphodiesterase family protein [Loigolactobacillus bifermentans]KRK33455.1 glycerophosphodiester phosphodiesterase family protein [Loigolactobacillus bifermentans DSM 20003]QGG61444.1 glycerophosphodiester phosphodiesterase [Loigolactobacillus bifermentans]
MKTVIFGHRGIPVKFPENSLAGFQYALEHGVEGLEFDVHLTRDNVPVIMHDERIDRTTNGQGRLRELTYHQLRQFKLANGESVPCLQELLALVGRQPVSLNLEFKTDQIQYQGIEARVLRCVAQTPLAQNVIYSSFNIATLQMANAIAPNQQYCYLADHVIQAPITFIRQQHLSGLHLSHYQPLRDYPERIWTVNDTPTLQKCFQNQVAGIFTDDFEHAMAVRAGKVMR